MTDARHGLSLWLDRLTLRSTLTDAECEAILALPGELELIRPNRDFVRLGEQVDRACLVVSGLAGRFGQTRDGERQMTALHIPGDMADLHSVVLPKAATALQSVSETLIYRVPHSAVHKLASQSLALAEAFWRDCMVDAAALSQWALVNARLSAKGRVAHLLCEMASRFSKEDCRAEQVIDWPLTQTTLGDTTGLTPVHVNRTLRALREAGAAHITDKRLHILDWKLLQSIGEFDARYLALERVDEAGLPRLFA
ncbi:Crp/Fnr family transcriptional regulator [Sphingomonas sp. PB4P5]|uniref:Crp/Fnr family transcriptional regulator n=1 Tax=Parasphingomonas puruogangriensis TaxID=3096155 RepID=UPI002FC6BE2C